MLIGFDAVNTREVHIPLELGPPAFLFDEAAIPDQAQPSGSREFGLQDRFAPAHKLLSAGGMMLPV
jgi:hypothetical protein